VEADVRLHLILILDLANLLVFTDQDNRLSTFDALLSASGMLVAARLAGFGALGVGQPAREFFGSRKARRPQHTTGSIGKHGLDSR
jgi:hypothetical protein